MTRRTRCSWHLRACPNMSRLVKRSAACRPSIFFTYWLLQEVEILQVWSPCESPFHAVGVYGNLQGAVGSSSRVQRSSAWVPSAKLGNYCVERTTMLRLCCMMFVGFVMIMTKEESMRSLVYCIRAAADHTSFLVNRYQ